MIVNELVTKFKFDIGAGFKQFDVRLKKAKSDVNSATTKMTGMFKRFGSSIKGALCHNLHLRGVKAAERNLNGLRSTAMSLKSTLMGIGSAYLGFQGLRAVMSRTLEVGMQNEKLFAGLSTLRGPQQATRDMRDLQTMAAKTPFQVGELTESFMRLNAAGFNVDINSMQKLGDLAANTTGKSIGDLTETMLSAARGQGAMVDNFNGMAGTAKNGGLEITSLDSKTGKLTTTMVKAGDKASLLGAYLNAAGETDTQGSMQRLSETMEGLSSTLQDNINLALLQFYKALEPTLKGLAKSAIKAVQEFTPLAKQFGVFLKLNLPRYIKQLQNAFKVLGPAIKAAAMAYLLFKTYMVSSAIATAVIGLGQGVQAFIALSKAQRLATIWGWAANAAIGAIPLAIAAVVAALAFLAYDFNEFMNTGDSALLRFTDRWPTLQDGIKNTYTLIESLGTGLMDLDGTMSWWAENSSSYTSTVKNEYAILFDAIKMYMGSWIQYAIAKFDQFVLWASTSFSSVMTSAYQLGSSILTAIMSPFNQIGSWLAGLPARAATAFAGLVSAARNAAANIPIIGGGISAMLGRNSGGYIPGSGNTDTVPTMLTPGEFVINKGTVRDILSGNPRGLMKLQGQMSAPQMAATGSTAISAQSVGSYSVPVGAMASGGTNITINAPMTQTNNINGMGGSASEVGAKLGNAAADRFSKGLSSAARQVPKRVARA